MTTDPTGEQMQEGVRVTAPYGREIIPQLDCLLAVESPIRRGWEFSREGLVRFRKSLGKLESLDQFETIGVSGSYARMEAGEGSDFDLIAIYKEDADPELLVKAERELKDRIAECGLRTPSGKGIFAVPICRGELFAASLGQIDESPKSFGIRIQLLLDGQPVWQEERFQNLQRDVLRRYLTPVPGAERTACWNYLVHDLARYFRSLALKYQWEDREQFPRWSLRNVKGGFSRPLMQVALLTLLGESLAEGRDPESWVAARLHLTPLERLVAALPSGREKPLQEIASAYGDFLQTISMSQIRNGMSEMEFLELR
ncbi:MAG: nucleotidyltransferase domain-containing protein, partial [Planctomycetaceae bacterium]|nr:nucleotidyltransferase domain-containing protein [Planctomycetaceae bacterium]